MCQEFCAKETWMKDIANLLFEAAHLKRTPRSGFNFLGAGKESVAEHTFCTLFIAWVMTKVETGVDALRLISMCLVHDLPESRIGDINYVQKQYVTADETSAMNHMGGNTSLGSDISDLVHEFNKGETLEARLAKDADQISLVIELKTLADIGFKPPHKWLPYVLKRLQTETGKQIAEAIAQTDWDTWWFKNYVDR
jgi:putative hydrolase of HD superfamily